MLSPDSELSHDLKEGVERVKTPDEWDNIGGIVPDLILYGHDDKPVRIIEVVVSSPPDARKRKKLEALRSRGVDVVEIKVNEERDLLNLCWVPWTPRFTSLTSKDTFSVNIATNQHKSGKRRQQDKVIQELIVALQSCSPKVRRDFWNVLKHLGQLDSLYPVRPDNPYRQELEAS